MERSEGYIGENVNDKLENMMVNRCVIKLTSFCTAEETTGKMKTAHRMGEMIANGVANDSTNKGLITKIYKQFMWFNQDFPVAQMVKNLPAIQEIRVQSLGREDPLEEVMATHSSILAWRMPWTEETGMLQSMESLRVGYG